MVKKSFSMSLGKSMGAKPRVASIGDSTPKWLGSVTGKPDIKPFGRPINQFGTTARKGLVSRTAAIRGSKI